MEQEGNGRPLRRALIDQATASTYVGARRRGSSPRSRCSAVPVRRTTAAVALCGSRVPVPRSTLPSAHVLHTAVDPSAVRPDCCPPSFPETDDPDEHTVDDHNGAGRTVPAGRPRSAASTRRCEPTPPDRQSRSGRALAIPGGSERSYSSLSTPSILGSF